MVENQDIEFKSVWKDEYLKWICGMANANGGTIYIGKDDKGKVVGVNNAIKLVKEIPNKIKDTMGIIPEVKIEEENDLLYLIIKVDEYPMPISYQGKFYLRSGSNNHEVTGSELDRFMLDRVGKRWEDLPVKNATFDDLSEEAFKAFREKSVKSGRLKPEDVEIDNEILLKI
ncbi:MAG: helix-turn-helix domain-containing protein [Christensenellales bacterium]